jgi:hypothetical protein
MLGSLKKWRNVKTGVVGQPFQGINLPVGQKILPVLSRWACHCFCSAPACPVTAQRPIKPRLYHFSLIIMIFENVR